MDQDKIFQLGKGFELGLISYESLSDSQKFDLSKYFAMKSDMLDGQITSTTAELTSINNRLDEAYKNLSQMM